MTTPSSSPASLFAQDLYFSSLHDHHPLTSEQEQTLLACRMLVKKDEAGDTKEWDIEPGAKTRLVQAYQPLVLTIARRYIHNSAGLDLMDLVQEGNVGLLLALRKYDPSLGTALSTLAYTEVRKTILAALHHNATLIPIEPRKARELRRLDHMEAALCVKLGREPSFRELAAALAITLVDLRELLVLRARQIISLDAPLGDGTETPLAELLQEVISRPQGKAALVHEAVASLSPMEQALLNERFSPDGEEATPRRVVAARLGVTPRDVERMEQAARRKIARYLAYTA